MSQGQTTILVQNCLDFLQDADSEQRRRARDELIEHSRHRLEILCRKMFFRSFKKTGAVDCDDVYQEATLKLWKSLEDIQPATVREYYGLATKKIREVLLDMCRKYVRDVPSLVDGGTSYSPVTAAMWTEFHEQVVKLSDDLRETFELLWYQELTQNEAAKLLGVDESTVKRRWRKAREQLSDYVL